MTPASGLVSLEFGESRGLVARLREAGSPIPWALPWGSLASYEGILAGAAPFVLLDEPLPDREARLIEYARVPGLLLGQAGHPLSSPAVRARMRRLSPALFRFGVVLNVESHWDRVVYRIAGPA
jgi:hypothetical protein